MSDVSAEGLSGKIDALRANLQNDVIGTLAVAKQNVEDALMYALSILPTSFATRTGTDVAGGLNQVKEGLEEMMNIVTTIDERLGEYQGNLI